MKSAVGTKRTSREVGEHVTFDPQRTFASTAKGPSLCGEIRCFLRLLHLVEVGAIHWIYAPREHLSESSDRMDCHRCIPVGRASSAVVEPM
jgi:hypothetical protein